MYIVKHKNGKKDLNIVVETKDVKSRTQLREIEKAKIKCAEVFFQILTNDGYTVHFREQIRNEKILQIINEVMGE
ncbi:hypothetical protein HMPREF9093_00305 [Fusobacterium sp. oral taxon 370 str. F0437]|nr:hypothetical protein [Fusobacterium sp. oral taxon 370]EHI79432.1 hypothetical protein HMPREF9093_00305 [Fusobacterium sp. oral taxon 370 str. F0437]